MKLRHSAQQIVSKLRLEDIELVEGSKVPEVCKQLGISEQMYCLIGKSMGGVMARGAALTTAARDDFAVTGQTVFVMLPFEQARMTGFNRSRSPTS